MLPFVATFISGVDELVGSWLADDFPDVKIDVLSDGLVIFETMATAGKVGKIRYLNNCFVLISQYRSDVSEIAKSTEILFRDKEVVKKLRQLGLVRGDWFKIVGSVENQTVSMDQESVKRLGELIQRGTGLKPAKFGPGREFWLMIRRDGAILFGLRITAKRKVTEAGELCPELANILCRLSEPRKTDIFLDPFAGSGAVFLERISSFPYKFAYAVDNEEQKIKSLEKKVTWTREKVRIRVGSALDLSDIEAGFIDKIVTDPPWGHFQKVIDIGGLYQNMFQEFSRVTKRGGIVIVLVAREIELESGPDFDLKGKYEILVSGKKASIYKFLRV